MKTNTLKHIVLLFEVDYMSIEEIAALFSCSKQYIHRELNKFGFRVPNLPRYGFKDPRCREKDQLLAIVKSHSTYEEVGKELGMPPRSVKNWMKYHEISKKEFIPYRFNRHHAWTGGIFERNGYLFINCDILNYNEFNPTHKQRYVMEHINLAEKQLTKIPLPENFIVHHLDGDTMNNEVENLAILTKSQHAFYHNMERRLLKKKHNKKSMKRATAMCVKWSEANIELLKMKGGL